jgi:hypothetical protein
MKQIIRILTAIDYETTIKDPPAEVLSSLLCSSLQSLKPTPTLLAHSFPEFFTPAWTRLRILEAEHGSRVSPSPSRLRRSV